MTTLDDLFRLGGQSPWIDNLTRKHLDDHTLEDLIDQGIRGLTSNPTIFQKAMASAGAYDEALTALDPSLSTEDAYWSLAIEDVQRACDLMMNVFEQSGHQDGFVSLEVSPYLAHDHLGTVDAAREIAERVQRPNLMVKIPATIEGLGAMSDVIAEGINVNATLIFSIKRYESVMEAFLEGLERLVDTQRCPLNDIHSVASFFVSRVDTAADARLEEIGTPDALDLRGKTAVAQAELAYAAYLARFAGDRWDSLASRGATPQRVLWASTSTKNPAYPALLYVESLIGPGTVNTMPPATVDDFLQHGTVQPRLDGATERATAHMMHLAQVGVDMALISDTLEREGVGSFAASFTELLSTLQRTRERNTNS